MAVLGTVVVVDGLIRGSFPSLIGLLVVAAIGAVGAAIGVSRAARR